MRIALNASNEPATPTRGLLVTAAELCGTDDFMTDDENEEPTMDNKPTLAPINKQNEGPTDECHSETRNSGKRTSFACNTKPA